MYKRFVRYKARWIFERFSEGDYEALLNTEASDLLFEYPGRHALGTTLTDIHAVRLWYERFFRFFPDIRFDLKSIVTKGGPWNTIVVVEWTAHATMPNGEPYENDGIHVLRIRWGKAVGIRVHLDTSKKAKSLAELAAGGFEEAAAEPIRDADVVGAHQRS
jgi:ketosteroid isomerase-like protein